MVVLEKKTKISEDTKGHRNSFLLH